jgi:hypothetical protein
MVVAWFAGFGPGLLSSALSTAAIAYFWTDRGDGLVRAVPDLSLFLLIAIAISTLIRIAAQGSRSRGRRGPLARAAPGGRGARPAEPPRHDQADRDLAAKATGG